MNNREVYNLGKKYFENLSLKYDYQSGTDKPYKLSGLNNLRNVIQEFEQIPFLKDGIDELKKSFLFTQTGNTLSVSSSDHSLISNYISNLRIGLTFLFNQIESNSLIDIDNSIAIKLPPLKTFTDLSKVANDFKKAIEIPILDSKIKSEFQIITAEPGSIWIMVALGTAVAVKLIGAITWSAAVLKKKNAEARIFEAHAKTLELKNEQIQLFINAQKTQLNNLLANEAEAIATNHYTAQEPEAIERLKLSITTVADLIEKGSKILSNSSSDSIKKLFPEYDKLSIIETAIKKISES